MENLPIFEIDESIIPIETPEKLKKSPKERVVQNELESSEKNLANDYMSFGKAIAEEMDKEGYHPVIIFGSSGSGKSTFLGSLFSYLQITMANGIGIYLGNSLIPLNTAQGKSAYTQAEQFFNHQLQKFQDGEAHTNTKTINDRPFFIPVRVKPPELPEIKFAFLESNGEWYCPDENTSKYFPELKEEINAILKFYQKGISFIHIAPFTQQNPSSLEKIDDKEELKKANLALVGALNTYEQLRVFREDDDHVLLVTKWDVSTKNNPIDGLANIDEEMLIRFAEETYRKGLAALRNLHIDNTQRTVLPYCAGMMEGRTIIRPTTQLGLIIDVFPKKLWNRLYGNATKCDLEIGRRLELIPQPSAPNRTIFSLMGSLVNKLLH
jgi:hypothetical protein